MNTEIREKGLRAAERSDELMGKAEASSGPLTAAVHKDTERTGNCREVPSIAGSARRKSTDKCPAGQGHLAYRQTEPHVSWSVTAL